MLTLEAACATPKHFIALCSEYFCDKVLFVIALMNDQNQQSKCWYPGGVQLYNIYIKSNSYE